MNKYIVTISKSVFLLVLLQAGLLKLNAQERYFDERYIYTQQFINPILVNAGATGMHGGHQFLINYRNKWAAFPGSPKTVTLSYDGQVADNLGFGALFMQDSYGALNTSKAQASFAYQINSPKNHVGFGLTGEYIQHSVGSIGNANPNDLALLARLDGVQFFDVSFGVYGKYDNRFTYGISLPSMVSSRLENDANQPNDRDLGFIFNVGYIHQSKATGITLEPSVFLKRLNGVPTHVDLNMRVSFLEDRFSGGVTYSVGAEKRLGFLLGMGVDNLGIFYSYNVSSQGFQDYNNGSHELTMRLRFGDKNMEKK